ncbi:MAG: hypothetical protein JO250_23450 [Armatimonadetes bacterium]|nr:hypothetical protein [Armatimonadota bacterium]
MDDQKRQPAQESAQQAREKGAALEYDAEDQGALDKDAPPPDREDTPHQEEKQP